ncbi:MAG: hypothetical protein H7240_09080 [Glaciimonas sp.]|nr:hypothetical protein [Glaciimonas sp.]
MATLAPDERELVQTIRAPFQSLFRIINDILDISRMEAGQLSLENAPFNLRETVERCRRLWARALKIKSVNFEFGISANVPDLLIDDGGQIMQILNNLLSHAVKFTPYGRILLDISGAPRTTGYALKITVCESGIGIRQQDQKRLFTPFSQASASFARKFCGTGLGLSMCKLLVGAMQGKISIASKYGCGTTVRLKLILSNPSTVSLPAPIDTMHQKIVKGCYIEAAPIAAKGTRPTYTPSLSSLWSISSSPL